MYHADLSPVVHCVSEAARVGTGPLISELAEEPSLAPCLDSMALSRLCVSLDGSGKPCRPESRGCDVRLPFAGFAEWTASPAGLLHQTPSASTVPPSEPRSAASAATSLAAQSAFVRRVRSASQPWTARKLLSSPPRRCPRSRRPRPRARTRVSWRRRLRPRTGARRSRPRRLRRSSRCGGRSTTTRRRFCANFRSS